MKPIMCSPRSKLPEDAVGALWFGYNGNNLTLGDPSDNRLLDVFIDGALACKPFMTQDLGDPGQMVPALALNELHARMHQVTPVALIPGGDPMTVIAGSEDLSKVNRYRRGVDQPVADSYRSCERLSSMRTFARSQHKANSTGPGSRRR